MVEIDRRVVALVGAIVVDNADLAAGWARLELFPRDMDGRPVASKCAGAWIEGVDLHRPQRRPRVTMALPLGMVSGSCHDFVSHVLLIREGCHASLVAPRRSNTASLEPRR